MISQGLNIVQQGIGTRAETLAEFEFQSRPIQESHQSIETAQAGASPRNQDLIAFELAQHGGVVGPYARCLRVWTQDAMDQFVELAAHPFDTQGYPFQQGFKHAKQYYLAIRAKQRMACGAFAKELDRLRLGVTHRHQTTGRQHEREFVRARIFGFGVDHDGRREVDRTIVFVQTIRFLQRSHLFAGR